MIKFNETVLTDYETNDAIWTDEIFRVGIENEEDVKDFQKAMEQECLETLEDVYEWLVDNGNNLVPEFYYLTEDWVNDFFKGKTPYEVLEYANQIDLGDDYVAIEASGVIHTYATVDSFVKNFGQTIIEQFMQAVNNDPIFN